jgi:hypothetical protein
MKSKIALFAISLIILLVCEFVVVRTIGGEKDVALTGGEAGRALLREAKLIDYFCLSRIPPLLGASLIPKEWEQALGSEITLSDQVGELSGMHTIIGSKADEIRNLQAGEFVVLHDQQTRQLWHLIYKPLSGGSRLLHISKQAEQFSDSGVGGRPTNWLILGGIAAAGALLITLLNGVLPSAARRDPI